MILISDFMWFIRFLLYAALHLQQRLHQKSLILNRITKERHCFLIDAGIYQYLK